MAAEVADLVIKVTREGVAEAGAELKGLGQAAEGSGEDAFKASIEWDALQQLMQSAGEAAAKAGIDFLASSGAINHTTDQITDMNRALAENKLLRGGLGQFGGPPGKGISTDIGSAFRGAANAAQGVLSVMLLISPTINVIISGIIGIIALLGTALVAATALAVAMGAVAAGMAAAALKWRDLLSTSTDGIDHMRASVGAIEAELFNGAKKVLAVFTQGQGVNNPWEKFAKLTIEAIRLVEPYILKVAGWVNDFLDTLNASGSATSPWVTFMHTWLDEWKKLGAIINEGIDSGGGLIAFLQKYQAPAQAFVEGIAKVINGIRKMSAAGLGLRMDQLAEFISNVFDALANLVQYFPIFSNSLVSVGLQVTRFIDDLLPIIDASIKIGAAILTNVVAPLVNGLLKTLDILMKVPFLRWLVELGGGFAFAAVGISKLSFGLLSFTAIIKSPVTLIRFIATVKQLGGPMATLAAYFPSLIPMVAALGESFVELGAAILGVETGGFLVGLVGVASVVGPLALGIAGVVHILGEWHKTQEQVRASNQVFIDQMSAGTLTMEQTTAAIAKNTIAMEDNASIASQAGQDVAGLFSGLKSSVLKMAEIPAMLATGGGDQLPRFLDQQAEAAQKAEAWAAAVEQVNGSLQEQADNINHGIQATGSMTDAQVEYALRLKNSQTGQAAFNSILGTADTQFHNNAISAGQYATILDQLGVSVDSGGNKVNLMALKIEAASNTIAQSVLQMQDTTGLVSKGLQKFALVSGQSWSDVQKAVDEAINDPTGGILGTGQKMTDFLQEQMDTITKWKETYATSINFVTAAWGTLGSQAKLTADNIVSALNKAVDQAAQMKKNIEDVVKAGLSPAAMAQITAQPVEAQASIFDALAGATHKQIQQINKDVRHGASLAEATANVVGDAIGLTFDKVLASIELLVSQDLGIPINQVRQRVARLTGDVNKKTAGIKDRKVKIDFDVVGFSGAAKGARENAASQASTGAQDVVAAMLPSQAAVKAAAQKVGEAAGQGVSDGFKSQQGAIQKAATTTADKGVEGAKKSLAPDKLQKVGSDAVKGLANGVSSAAPGLAAQMTSAGNQMGQGLRQGLLAALAQTKVDAVAAANDIANAVKQATQQTSPSKVFYKIGHNMGEGMRIGFGDSMEAMTRDVRTGQKKLQSGWGYSGGRRKRDITGRLRFDWRRGSADLDGAMAWESRNAL